MSHSGSLHGQVLNRLRGDKIHLKVSTGCSNDKFKSNLHPATAWIWWVIKCAGLERFQWRVLSVITRVKFLFYCCVISQTLNIINECPLVELLIPVSILRLPELLEVGLTLVYVTGLSD